MTARWSLGEALAASGATVHTTLGVRRILDPDAVERVRRRKADWRRS